jgi:hypothetical protein
MKCTEKAKWFIAALGPWGLAALEVDDGNHKTFRATYCDSVPHGRLISLSALFVPLHRLLLIAHLNKPLYLGKRLYQGHHLGHK